MLRPTTPLSSDDLKRIYDTVIFGDECAHCCVSLRHLVRVLADEVIAAQEELAAIRRTKRIELSRATA